MHPNRSGSIRNRTSGMLLIVTALVLVSGRVEAAPDKVTYELQERCGRRAEQWFKREFGNGIENTKEGQAINTFRNHYNAKLNKCFLLSIRTAVNYKTDHSTDVLEVLSDMNDNKELGEFFEKSHKGMGCYLGEKQCTTRGDWEQLLKPFLED